MSQASKKPNVIWIFGDQHRGQALSCMGDPNVNTPALDRMSAEGVHFRAAVAGMPLCCPFRGSLVTGLYPHKAVPGHEYPLDPATPTIAHALKDAGYDTAYIGKWHLDGWRERDGRAAMHIVPPERRGGFDKWIGYDNNNAQWDCWVHGGEGDGAFHYRLDGYETDCLTDMLIDHLRERAAEPDKPFFAALSVQPPHNPYVAPDAYMRRHNPASLQLRPNVARSEEITERCRRELAGYYAQIENLDANVQRVIDALGELKLAEDTWVIFFSDHGDMHGSQGQFHKMTAYEEAIRIPFIAWKLTSRYDCRHALNDDIPINHVDIAPTTLGLCGVEAPAAMQGTDYSSVIMPGRKVGDLPEAAYIQSVVPTCHGESVDLPWRGIVTRDGWKYVCFEHTPWLMFNLNEDPYEQVNMAYNSRYRDKRRQLHRQLAEWIARTDDEFNLPELAC